MNATDYYARRAIAQYEAIHQIPTEPNANKEIDRQTQEWLMEAMVGIALGALVTEISYVVYSVVAVAAGW